MMKRNAVIGLCILLIGGCTLYQKPIVPTPCVPKHFKQASKVTHAVLHDQWWENFHDEKLNQLVALAIQHNVNYQVALKNIEIARTYVAQNESALYPQVNLNFNVSRNKSMSIFNTDNFISSANTSIVNNAGNNQAGFGRIYNLDQLFGSVSYELDLWNQIGNSVNQAKANVVGTSADSEVIRLTLLSSVVTTYFQIQALTANIANLTQQYQLTNESLHVNHSQYRAQLIDVGVLSNVKNQVEELKIAIEQAKKQKEILINMLAYLIGELPETFVSVPGDSLHSMPYAKLIPAGLPSSMMANRPDIQSSYFAVLSYGYVEKQAIANFLPSFNLTGNYGYANTSFSKFLSPTNTFWNYGLSLLQPVFDYKIRMSEYQRSKYQYESAILNYKNTVINAFQEVNNALVSYQDDHVALLAYQQEIKHSNDKVAVSQAQYQSGMGDYVSYLNDKLLLLQNRYHLINQQLLVIEDVIQVYKSLGMGVTKPC